MSSSLTSPSVLRPNSNPFAPPRFCSVHVLSVPTPVEHIAPAFPYFAGTDVHPLQLSRQPK
jgi:hypothetical protein